MAKQTRQNEDETVRLVANAEAARKRNDEATAKANEQRAYEVFSEDLGPSEAARIMEAVTGYTPPRQTQRSPRPQQARKSRSEQIARAKQRNNDHDNTTSGRTMSKLSSAEQLRFAYHEAGHAAVARWVGLSVDGVELHEKGGLCKASENGKPVPTIAMLLGGMAADNTFYGWPMQDRFLKSEGSDWQKAEQIAKNTEPTWKSASHTETFSAGMMRALRLVRENKPAIRRVAKQLHQSWHVSSRELDQLLKG
jgi:hypothetical protein